MSIKHAPGQIVSIKVRETLFQTTIFTLSSRHSLLRNMVQDLDDHTDSDGIVNIDRSPKRFSSILNYLRDGTVALPENILGMMEVRAEAKYYQLEGLVQLCDIAANDLLPRAFKEHSTKVTIIRSRSDYLTYLNREPSSRSKLLICLAINRNLYNCKDYDDTCRFYEAIIKNIELFDKFSLKLSHLGCFVRYTDSQEKAGCHWTFNGNSTKVLNTSTDDFANIKYPESEIYRTVMKQVVDFGRVERVPEDTKAINTPTESEKVIVNVGGHLFNTSKQVLSSCDGMLRGMFNDSMTSNADQKGHVFIDRSEKHFQTILDYLRDGKVTLPTKVSKLQELKAEANFYLIEELEKLCHSKIMELSHYETTSTNHISIITTDNELEQLVKVTAKPIVSLMINRQQSKSTNKEQLCKEYLHFIKNVELFEDFVVKFRDHATFVRDFRQKGRNRCCWDFYDKKGDVMSAHHFCDIDGEIRFIENDVLEAMLSCII